MFELLFKYPLAAFSKGTLVLAGRWPVWLLPALLIAGAVLLGWPMLKERGVSQIRRVCVWLLQTCLLALLLLLLWQPSLSIATLRPQQNVVAVLLDDSKSMALSDAEGARVEQASALIKSNLLPDLQKKFQVRLYTAGADLQRLSSVDSVHANAPSTRLGGALKKVAAESSSLPIGAVVLLSDGGETAGGIDLATMSEIRRQHIPIHTVGFGREKAAHDVEIVDVDVPGKVQADSRTAAQVTIRQQGYNGRKVRISVVGDSKVLATREVALKPEGGEQSESLSFNAGAAGAKTLQVKVDALGGEENTANNSLHRLLSVDGGKPRILYLEGEPKWEFKFIRRAIELDTGLQLASLLRTTQNKVFRQGVDAAGELEQGFPSKVEELFGFQAVIIGGVEVNYFTPAQQELLRQFVDRRGGGLLFLGGRGGLADGGWTRSPLSDLLPVTLPDKKDTFHREPATVELTAAGFDNLLCRLEDDPARNAERWKKLPYLQNYQEPGVPKPGAVVLADMTPTNGRGKLPLLTIQKYGRGRTALFATAGSWRWQMSQPLEDMSHEMFWQQMLRWLVTGTNGRVVSSLPTQVFSDEQRIPLRVEVRDKTYLPASDAHVEAHILGPGGISDTVELRPEATQPGVYTGEYGAVSQGSYVVETVARRGEEEAGRDVVNFLREDGIEESFHTEQNRELLEKLSAQTGGKYYRPSEAKSLGKDISFSEAGISVRETRDLWNMPIVFALALLLRGAEWLLRRKWGTV